MPSIHDGPASALFTPLALQGNASLPGLSERGLSADMAAALEHAPSGACTAWGIPFQIDEVILLTGQPVSIQIQPTTAPWFIFMHTSDTLELEKNAHGFVSPMRGPGQLGQSAARYGMTYADGSQAAVDIRYRFQIGAYQRRWGENCFEAVATHKPQPFRAGQEQTNPDWGYSQTRATAADGDRWGNWLWAWENPHPEKAISGFTFEPAAGLLVISAITAGQVCQHAPALAAARAKPACACRQGRPSSPIWMSMACSEQIRLDLGQVISASLRPLYPNDRLGRQLQQPVSARPHKMKFSSNTRPIPKPASIWRDGR